MTYISDFERASLQRRMEMVRESIYNLSDQSLTTSERATNLRSALDELRHLEDLLTESRVSQ